MTCWAKNIDIKKLQIKHIKINVDIKSKDSNFVRN